MLRHHAPISLAELAAAGVRLRPFEAVTLVRELILQVVRGDVAGVPSSHVIRLSPDGAVFVEGPVAAGGRPVVRASQLLDSLLPTSDAGPDFRVPGGLKLVIARASGAIDLPPFGSLESFADALARFGAPDARATIMRVVAAAADAATGAVPEEPSPDALPAPLAHVEPFQAYKIPQMPAVSGPLTISDIRRARRATGLTLGAVAQRSRIPVPLLRQLEWGYFANWPNGHYGRIQLIRYARAAGLDEQLVVSTVVPLIEEQGEALREALVPHPLPITVKDEVVDAGEVRILPALPPVGLPAAAPGRSRRYLLGALAIPALLAIGLLPVWWSNSLDPVATPHPAGTAGPIEAVTPPAALRRELPLAAPSSADRGATAPPAADDPAGQPPVVSALAEDAAVPSSEDAAADGVRDAAHRLTADEVAYSPSFASAGTAMFYHSNEDGGAALVRADTDSGGAVLRVTKIVDDNAKNYHVRPSPDGTRIAFDSDRDGVRGVYLADADGKNVRRVSPEGFAAVPSWSPDGTTLAFVRAEPERPAVWNLWTLELQSGELRQITRHRYGQPWGGSWFPDGERIAYSHEDRLVVRDLRTGRERVFRSPRKGLLVRTPAVSPDGRRVVFQLFPRSGVWLLELTDGSMRKILEDGTAEEFTWAPDGKRVAYHSRKSGTWGVWVMAPR